MLQFVKLDFFSSYNLFIKCWFLIFFPIFCFSPLFQSPILSLQTVRSWSVPGGAHRRWGHRNEAAGAPAAREAREAPAPAEAEAPPPPPAMVDLLDMEVSWGRT